MTLRIRQFRRAGLVLACVAAAAFVSRSDLQGDQDRGSEQRLLITVLDADGTPIRDLRAGEFVVREDDVARSITGAQLATEPLAITLLVDTTLPPPGASSSIQDIRSALGEFVRTVHASSPATPIALIEFGGAAVMSVDFTATAAELEQTIVRLFPTQQSTGVHFEALLEGARSLREQGSPRRAMVSLDINSIETTTERPSLVAEQVEESLASFWSVSLQGAGGDVSPVREAMVDYLTDQTGGLRLRTAASSALPTLLKQVAAALTSQYVITYQRPSGAGDPESISAGVTRGARILQGTIAR